MSQPAASSRRTLIVIALLFLLPVALSFYLYYGRSPWRPAASVNHGELIAPPRPLPVLTLRGPSGLEIASPFAGAWSLIYVSAGRCDAQCRQALYVMRQVRLALNRDSERVRRIFLYQGECCEQPYFSREQQGLLMLDLSSDAEGRLVGAFPPTELPLAESGRIWLADPHGNLMMSYTSGVDPKGMLADLKRLLKLSHIG